MIRQILQLFLLINLFFDKNYAQKDDLKRSMCFTKKEMREKKFLKLEGVLVLKELKILWINGEKILFNDEKVTLKNGVSILITDVYDSYIVIKVLICAYENEYSEEIILKINQNIQIKYLNGRVYKTRNNFNS